MAVQDDERERELVRMFNLDWDPSHSRGGVDATLEVEVDGVRIRLDVEVKSTTGETVSTARDVGMEHMAKWRRKLFVIGFYSRRAGRPELLRSLCLTPLDMAPWIDSIERKIAPDFKIAELATRRLELQDVFDVCGKQARYTVGDAKRLHKMQWNAAQYQAACDVVVGAKAFISPPRMLEILRLRSRYIAERGATLNNPHITKTHLRAFTGTDREVPAQDWAASVRRIATAFVVQHRDHPALARA